MKKSTDALRMAGNLGQFFGPRPAPSPGEPSETASPPKTLTPVLQAALSAWLGFAAVALTNAIFIASRLSLPAEGRLLRLQHHWFDLAGILGVGLLAAMVFAGGSITSAFRAASTPERQIRSFALLMLSWAASTAIFIELVGHELHRIALILFQGRIEQPLFLLAAATTGLFAPISYFISSRSNKRRSFRAIVLLASFVLLSTNHLLLRDDYAGAHGGLAWLGALLFGPAARPSVELWLCSLGRLRRRILVAAFAGIGLLGLILRPSMTVRAELFREPSAISAWLFARFLWPNPGISPTEPPKVFSNRPFFQDRDKLAPMEPTTPPLAAGVSPIVVLLTIDAVRADVLEAQSLESRFPALSALKRRGAYFSNAIAPGSQTAISLSAMFSSRYFSQMTWRDYGRGSTRFVYPAEDTSPRFPELLARASIQTVGYCSIAFLANEYGVARGFVEEYVVTKGREHARAEDVMEPLLLRVQQAKDEPLFVFAHLTEPHAPYDRGGKKGSNFERYLSEIAIVDGYVDKLAALLEMRFPDRGYLFVTSDHGEAFGEHGTVKHTKTLYDELLRIPLLAIGPGVKPRRIADPVGLIDIGPTLLDLFQVQTPGTFMGQSLVPLLAGREAHFTRPLLAEGRKRRALYWEGLKVIDDPRRKLVEVFDLTKDPKERHNLFESSNGRADEALLALRTFFLVHQTRAPGYEPPYRP